MSHQVITENNSVNDAVYFTKNIDSPAAIAVKKIMDIGNKCLKASNNKLHFCNSSIPIVGFVVSLVGLVLQAYSTINDKGKPKWLKGLALIVLGATAALTITIFVLSVQFPPVVLTLSFIVIGIGVVRQTLDFMHSLGRLFVAKYKVTSPSNKDDIDKIIGLNSKKSMLFKQQTRLISVINDDKEKRTGLQSSLKQVQQKIIKTENKIQQLKSPVSHMEKKYSKEKRRITGAFFSLSTCIGSSILGVIGLTIAVGNPPLGLALIALGLVFDAIILSRKVNKWIKRREKEKNKEKEFEDKSKRLFAESVDYLGKEKEGVKQSFKGVVSQLNHHKILIKKENPLVKLSTNMNQIKPIFSGTSQLSIGFFGTNKAGNDSLVEKEVSSCLSSDCMTNQEILLSRGRLLNVR